MRLTSLALFLLSLAGLYFQYAGLQELVEISVEIEGVSQETVQLLVRRCWMAFFCLSAAVAFLFTVTRKRG